MNNSAIEKGLFRAQKLQKYFETITKNPASSQTGIFMKPDNNKVDIIKDVNYDKLSEEGYAKVETVIVDGDVIIGMVNPKPVTKENEKPYKDSSTVYKSLIPGAIDKVITGENNDGYPIIKLRVRSERIPDIGDKFSSRHGQKGTIGYKPHRADLMFSRSGLIPDIIINPNAMTKRMTIGQLIESLESKVCAIKGVYGDATPFMGVNIRKMNEDLVDSGYEEWGNETMYNGRNGRKIQTKIFIGPTYYQRLKQMVGDKAHCLSTDHEVLTLDGWKFNHQLTTDDKVATLVDGKLVYQNPIRVLNYPNYKGDMYHIKIQQLDLMVTPNHRMWVSKSNELKYDFELAEDIVGQGRRYKKDAVWDTSDYQFTLSDKMDMDSYLKQFDAEVKLLPKWVWNLSSRQARILLESIVKDQIFNTSSERLSDDIMRLALHCGWSANKSNIDDVWELEINKSENTPEVNCGEKQTEEIIKNYDKPVFCLEVPGGVFYVRRNGKAVWTGNSRARGPVQLLTRQPPEATTTISLFIWWPPVIPKVWLVCRYAGNTFKLRGTLQKIELKIIVNKDKIVFYRNTMSKKYSGSKTSRKQSGSKTSKKKSEEIWKKFPHRKLKDRYEVSNMGNVRNSANGYIKTWRCVRIQIIYIFHKRKIYTF